ncbi:hypothetical protein UlMin_012192 [Ulmus minor]
MELAAAVLQTVLGEVIKVVGREAQCALGFKGEFADMQKMLDRATKLHADKANLKDKDQVTRVALIQLREVVYKADDILIDCLLRYEDVEGHWIRRSCLRITESFLSKTSKELTEINKQLKERMEFLTTLPDNNTQTKHEEPIVKPQTRNVDVVIGLHNDLKTINEWISQKNKKLQRIAILGMGGLGKTTIARQIYNDKEFRRKSSAGLRRFDEIIWVTVSKNFNKDRILEDVLKKLGGTGSEDSSDFMTKIKEKLENKTCLLVLDDVWRIDEIIWWSDLCAVLTSTVSGRSSCIITTTRFERVANVVVDEDKRIHKPSTLDKQNSWLLFSRLAFPSSEGNRGKAQLEEIGKEIVEKCGGLPLAIKAIAPTMSSKTTIAEWTEVKESYHSSLIEGEDHEVMTSLKWSYYELPALLKQCLLCFSVYPEDFEIRAEQLIHWWIAEGLVQQRNQKCSLEVGYECLLGLTSRCLVEVVECRGFDGRVSSCKLHDIVRDLIIQIAEEEGFCSFNQQQGTQVEKTAPYWLAFNYEKDKKDEKDETVLGDNSKLRALLLKVKSPVGRIFESSLPSLRMLDISGSKLNNKEVKDLLVWICALKRLASLNLSNVEGLEELPSSISELLNLQILILSGCTKLKKIPDSITRLKKLIVLKVGGCSSLEYLPRGLEKLSNLQELTGFKVANQTKTKGCELTELSNLTNLRVLRIVIRDEAVKVSGIGLNKILSELKELKILAINADECKEQVWKMVDSLTPPPNLLELYLCNYNRKNLPKWFCPSKLPKLQYLSIENGDIVNMNPGAENESSNCKWNVLEGLCLKQLPRLAVEWKDLKKVMPGLRYLEVSRCSNLANKNFPCSVEKPGVWRE